MAARLEGLIAIRTELMRRLGVACPIIQAPLSGGGDTAELVAAVGEAGGIGFIGAGYLTPEQIIERGRAVRGLSSRPFGINLFAPVAAPGLPADVRPALARVAPFFAELGLPGPVISEASGASFDSLLAAALEIGLLRSALLLGLFLLTRWRLFGGGG